MNKIDKENVISVFSKCPCCLNCFPNILEGIRTIRVSCKQIKNINYFLIHFYFNEHGDNNYIRFNCGSNSLSFRREFEKLDYYVCINNSHNEERVANLQDVFNYINKFYNNLIFV